MLNNSLVRNLGIPTRKQKLEANTPMKHFLRPIIEDAMIKKMQMMQGQQAPELPSDIGGMVEPPTINPLQNALMGQGQQGGGGTPQGNIGGMTYGNPRTNSATF